MVRLPPVTVPWGAYTLTCRHEVRDGRTVLTSLTVEAGPGEVVDHACLRALRAGEIAEAARAALAVALAASGRSPGPATTPRPRTVRDGRPPSAALERVAALHAQARAAGGDLARRPALYVHQWLQEAGVDVTLSAVRGQIHRARVKGLIPR